MEFKELVAQRYSVRAYKSDPVEEDKLQQILEAARLAPTAANKQPIKLIIVNTHGRQEDLQKIYGPSWFTDAPMIICVCVEPSEAWVRRKDEKNHSDIDAAIVMDHLILAATSLGLGTCWVGAFDPDAAREVLNIPDDLVPVLFTPLGYPADKPREKRRKSLHEIVSYIR